MIRVENVPNKGTLDIYIRPLMRRYRTSYSVTDTYNDIVRDRDLLPRASEHPLQIELRRTGFGANLLFDGCHVASITGTIQSASYTLNAAASIGRFFAESVSYDTTRYLPLEIGALRMARSFAGATNSLPAGFNVVSNVPFYVAGGKQSGGAAKAAEESEKPEKKTVEKEETLDELMAQLDSLIGLETVKHEVRSLINLIKVRAMRKEHDLKVMNMSFHMVFTGNPGTGKTTVARLVAKIYKQLGFLSKGQLIETDRSGLVAGYVGQTAGKVTDVVNSALGGILFIDEAYALARKGMENDFGHEAIDTLVKLMEDHRDDLVVIVAGYTDEMHDFLTSNPGLISRFNKYIDFPDYTDDELMAILEMNAGRQGYRVAEAAKAVVRGMLVKMTLSERMDFGNARGMRNTLEKLVQAQANRLAACEGEVTRDMLEEITEADAKAALVGEEEQKQADSENVAQLAERGEQE